MTAENWENTFVALEWEQRANKAAGNQAMLREVGRLAAIAATKNVELEPGVRALTFCDGSILVHWVGKGVGAFRSGKYWREWKRKNKDFPQLKDGERVTLG